MALWGKLQSNIECSFEDAELIAVFKGIPEGLAVLELCQEVFGSFPDMKASGC